MSSNDSTTGPEAAADNERDAVWLGGVIHFTADPAEGEKWIPCWFEPTTAPVALGEGYDTPAEALPRLVDALQQALREYPPPLELRVAEARLFEALQPLADEGDIRVTLHDAMPEFEAWERSFNDGFTAMNKAVAEGADPADLAKMFEAAGFEDADGGFADLLQQALGGEAEQAGFDPAALGDMFRDPPPITDGEGVGDAHVAAFAHAADALFAAAPWKALPPHHLFRVEPVDGSDPPAGMAFINLIGKADEQQGVTFYGSVDGFTDFWNQAADLGNPLEMFKEERWTLTWDPAGEVPDGTLNLWLSLDLPTAPSRASDPQKHRLFPVPLAFGPDGPQTPDKARLIFITRLCEALAELDANQPQATLETEHLRIVPVELGEVG